MSNDVIINVKVNNQANFGGIQQTLAGIGGAAAGAGQQLTGAFGAATGPISSVGTSLAGVGGQLASTGGAAASATGPIGAVASALITAAAAAGTAVVSFAALGPALIVAAGAAAAAATAFAGAGIALGTLMIGFGGIGAALTAHSKQQAAAGGAAKGNGEAQYQAAKRVRDATEALKDAKAREVDAAKDVNRARADEIDRLRELDLALRGQKISQAEAAQALVEAKEKARRANIAGSDWEKAEANNAVKRAQLEYDSVSEKLGDLTAEKKKADREGVEGSDQVQTALKHQAEAHKATLKAQESLAEAHHKVATASAGAAGGINAFDQAMKKLSPNAQALVHTLINVEAQFDKIKKKVQDHLLAGFSTEVQNLADKWMPHLDNILTDMADHLNSFGKNLMHALGDNDFIKNMESAGKAMGKALDTLSPGVDSLVDAFGRLAGHAGPVLQVIAKAVAGIFTHFDKWIKSADKSGKLDSFMAGAASTLQKIFDIGGKVFKVIGQFIGIIFTDSNRAGSSVLDGISDVLDKISKWLSDPKHIKDIQAITAKVVELVEKFMKHLPQIIALGAKLFNAYVSGVKTFDKFKDKVEGVFKSIGQKWDSFTNKVKSVFNWIGNAGSSLGRTLSGIWHGLENGFKNAINAIIRGWNNLQFTIGGGSWAGVSIPSVTFNTPNIPYMAHGGIGGGLAVVGERGRELIRMPQGSTVIPNGQAESMLSAGGGGGGHLTIGFDRGGPGLESALIDMIQNYVRKRGGNTQVALGRAGAAG